MITEAAPRAANRLEMAAQLIERGALRYTPAGLPMLDGRIAHLSMQREAGAERRIEVELPVVFAGSAAEQANRLPVGSALTVSGFVAPRRKGSRSIVLHVTEFE